MSPRSLAVLCTCLGALLVSAPAAQAACTSSTPSSTSFTDTANDVEGIGPDLTELKFSLDAACTFAFDPGLSAFTVEDVVVNYIDRDGNATTGDAELFGTDLATLSFNDGAKSVTFFAWWDGTTYVLDETNIVETAPAPGGFSVPVDRLGIPPGTTPAFRVIAMRLGETDFGFDAAPEPASGAAITLPVAYDGTPIVPALPAPSPQPQNPNPSLPRLPVIPPSKATPGCTVPKVKGRSLAVAKTRLTARGCKPAVNVVRRYSTTVRKGRVIGTSPGTGTRTTKKIKLIVSKGKRPKRARASAAPRDLVIRARAVLRSL